MPAGIGAIRMYSTTAALAAMHAHAIAAAAFLASGRSLIDPALESQLKQVTRNLAEARAPWWRLQPLQNAAPVFDARRHY